MVPYNTTWFDPPAPVAYVTLRDPQLDTIVTDVPLLLDTGADVSLVPHYAVQQLGTVLLSDSQHTLVGFDGSVSVSPSAQLELAFLKRTFRGRYLVIEQSWGILG